MEIQTGKSPLGDWDAFRRDEKGKWDDSAKKKMIGEEFKEASVLWDKEEIKTLEKKLKGQRELADDMVDKITQATILWEKIKHRFVGEDIGLAKNELNKIIGTTL